MRTRLRAMAVGWSASSEEGHPIVPSGAHGYSNRDMRSAAAY